MDLARKSHRFTATAADMPANPAGPPVRLRSVRVLDVLSSTPARPNCRAPCLYRHLHDLASRIGEICGLASALHPTLVIPCHLQMSRNRLGRCNREISPEAQILMVPLMLPHRSTLAQLPSGVITAMPQPFRSRTGRRSVAPCAANRKRTCYVFLSASQRTARASRWATPRQMRPCHRLVRSDALAVRVAFIAFPPPEDYRFSFFEKSDRLAATRLSQSSGGLPFLSIFSNTA